MGGWAIPLVLLTVWLAVGAFTGVRLERRGHPATTAVSALVAWPLLLTLLDADPSHVGPYAATIERTFQGLHSTLADPVAGDVPWTGDLETLRRSLHAADARLHMVDRLLADAGDPDGTLTQARATSADELVAVLRGVDALRLQVGLYALEGGGQSVQEALHALQARASALSEVRGARWSG